MSRIARVIGVGIAGFVLSVGSAAAQETLKLAIGQRGAWENSAPELGQNAGIFKKHGLTLELLYTQGSGETLQAVISGSVDIGVGVGTHSALGAFAKGAPVRVIGGSFTGVDDLFYYVRADSPLKTMGEATGRTIAISSTGSAGHIIALALAEHFGVNLTPQVTGSYPSTLTQVMTAQVDIGFATSPFGLEAVEQGRIRILTPAAVVPQLRNQTLRALIANAGVVERRADTVKRFIAGYREALDWMYSGDPRVMNGYSGLVGMPEKTAAMAVAGYHPRESVEPTRVDGLDAIQADAVKFKYIPALLNSAQLAEFVRIPDVERRAETAQPR
jgi:NitT/TauT family transport system substrate-binding protein